MSQVRHRTWQGLVFAVAAMVLSSCGWRGISNVELPGGPGGGGGGYTVYVQMPDTLAINGNSKVMVADVFVGSIRNIELKNWVATLTLGLDNRRMCFKCVPDTFDELVEQEHIRPAPYVGRYKWVMLNRLDALRDDELQELIKQSFEMVAAKAPKNGHAVKKKGTVKGKIRRKKS